MLNKYREVGLKLRLLRCAKQIQRSGVKIKLLRCAKQIQRSGVKIKVIERPGRTLKSFIQRPDSFKGRNCGRKDCFICESGGKGGCGEENVNYEIVCQLECRVKDIYIPESHRIMGM